MHPPLVPRKMPVVSSRAHNCSYQIDLVASGQVKPLAAYLPSGNGTSVVVVSNIRPKQKKQPAKGLGLTTDLTLVEGTCAEDVVVHLCTDKCKQSGNRTTSSSSNASKHIAQTSSALASGAGSAVSINCVMAPS